MTVKKIGLFLIVLCFTTHIAFAETFFWDDKKGIHMTSDVSKLPPNFRKKYEKFMQGNTQVSDQKQQSQIKEIVEVPKPVSIPESAKNAYKALKKLEARCDAGISYKDYAPVLGEARFEVNMFLDSTDAKKFPEIINSLTKALEHFTFVKSMWDIKFRGSAVENFVRLDSRDGNIFLMNYPDATSDMKDGGATMYANYAQARVIYIDAAISFILNEASNELETSKKLITY